MPGKLTSVEPVRKSVTVPQPRSARAARRLDFLSMGQFGNGRGIGVRQVR
jgi:hypothetical protein